MFGDMHCAFSWCRFLSLVTVRVSGVPPLSGAVLRESGLRCSPGSIHILAVWNCCQIDVGLNGIGGIVMIVLNVCWSGSVFWIIVGVCVVR